MKEKVIQEEIS